MKGIRQIVDMANVRMESNIGPIFVTTALVAGYWAPNIRLQHTRRKRSVRWALEGLAGVLLAVMSESLVLPLVTTVTYRRANRQVTCSNSVAAGPASESLPI